MENFPKPIVPLHPVLSADSLSWRQKKPAIPGLFDNKSAILLTSGRMGIAYALQHHGIRSGDKVLIPAYHCSSMIDPAVWLGAVPVFFRINADCSVDLEDIAAKIDTKTKLIIITHYFGFHQDMTAITRLCKENNVVVLEDCAHAAFGEIEGRPLGSFGDYAIASALKFYPVFDGGCLLSLNQDIHHLGTASGGLKFNLKAIFNTLETAFAYNRLSLLKHTVGLLFKLKDKLWGKLKSSHVELASTPMGPVASEGGFDFDAEWVNKHISWISNLVVSFTNTQRLIEKRRRNYQRLHLALLDLQGTKPLFAELPEKVVPYVYPLIVDEPEKHFAPLKRQAVPILRFGEFLWEGVDAETCENSDYLSKHVFQFPCHQELSDSELDWIINTVRKTVGGDTTETTQ